MVGRGWRRGTALTAAGAVLALLLAGCGGNAPAASPGSTPPTATTGSGGSGGSGGTSGGPVPTPQEETYQGCPPEGDGGDHQLNLLKNRIDTGAWQSTSVQSLLALTWPQDVQKAMRDTWSSSDIAAVDQNEGRPVEAEGYILLVRHEGPESVNCHDQTQRDYHVWLAASPSDSRANSIIVELTPRVVARNPGWGGQSTILGLIGHHVRVSGWLLLDQEHPEQLHLTRGTLWEIHPVMRVEVDQNGTWADLASGQVALGTGRAGAGSTGPSGTSSGGSGSSRSRHRRHRRATATRSHRRRRSY